MTSKGKQPGITDYSTVNTFRVTEDNLFGSKMVIIINVGGYLLEIMEAVFSWYLLSSPWLLLLS